MFYTVFLEDEKLAIVIGKAIPLACYEYSHMLMENLKLRWDRSDPHTQGKKRRNMAGFPLFRKPLYCGKSVDFLTEQQAPYFCLLGNTDSISP